VPIPYNSLGLTVPLGFPPSFSPPTPILNRTPFFSFAAFVKGGALGGNLSTPPFFWNKARGDFLPLFPFGPMMCSAQLCAVKKMFGFGNKAFCGGCPFFFGQLCALPFRPLWFGTCSVFFPWLAKKLSFQNPNGFPPRLDFIFRYNFVGNNPALLFSPPFPRVLLPRIFFDFASGGMGRGHLVFVTPFCFPPLGTFFAWGLFFFPPPPFSQNTKPPPPGCRHVPSEKALSGPPSKAFFLDLGSPDFVFFKSPRPQMGRRCSFKKGPFLDHSLKTLFFSFALSQKKKNPVEPPTHTLSKKPHPPFQGGVSKGLGPQVNKEHPC